MDLNLKKNLLVCALSFTLLFAFPLHAQMDEESEIAFMENETPAGNETTVAETATTGSDAPAAASASSGVESATSVGIAASTRPEMKLVLAQSFKVPFLQGRNPLLRGNNIKFDMKYEVSPIFMYFFSDIVFTPIALLEFDAGAYVGSGWNTGEWPNQTRGIGVNRPRIENGNTVLDSSGRRLTSVDNDPFDGTFMGGHFGAAFQFNLGAVVRGNDWNHLIFKTHHKLAYNAFTGAGPGEAWFALNDEGENRNGWKYSANYVLGYSMPALPILKMFGLHVESDKYITELPDGHLWGDTKMRWDFGFVMQFKFFENFTGSLLTQFRLHRKYDNYDPYVLVFGKARGGDEHVYYEDRVLADGGQLKFYRVALTLNYRFN